MNKKIKAQLEQIAATLPMIEYKNINSYKLITGKEYLELKELELSAKGKKMTEADYLDDSGEKIKPGKTYKTCIGKRQVDHFAKLKEVYRTHGWPGVEEYQKIVRDQYSTIS